MKKKWMGPGFRIGLFLLTLLCGFDAWAQQANVLTAQATTYPDEWYLQPWIWLLSGGLFVLIFTVIISREDKRDA